MCKGQVKLRGFAVKMENPNLEMEDFGVPHGTNIFGNPQMRINHGGNLYGYNL